MDLFCNIQVCNGVGDCPDSLLAPLKGPTDEEGCRSWSSWGPWSPCSATCGTGSMSRRRTCPAGNPLYLCRGQALQRQQCFNITCPGRGGSRQLRQHIADATLRIRLMSSSVLLSSGRSVAAVGVLVQLFQQLRWNSGQTSRLHPSSLWRPGLLPAAGTIPSSHGNQ